MSFSTLVLGVFYLAGVSAASVSRQIQLGDHEYFIPPTAAWKLDSWNASVSDEFTPLTVVKLNQTANAERVASALETYENDDVWTKEFTQGESHG